MKSEREREREKKIARSVIFYIYYLEPVLREIHRELDGH